MEDITKNFLNTLQEINDKRIAVFCPYTKKTVSSLPISFKQQKNLISTLTDGTLGVMRFNKILNEIIIENTGEDLYIVDKIPAIIKLRIESIGEIISIDGEKVDITPTLDKIKTLKFPELVPVEHDAFKINLSIPTLREEIVVTNSIIDDLKKDSKDLGRNIVNVYTHEILKFVDNIQIGDDVLKYRDLSIKDRMNIIEKIPLLVNKRIIKEIEKLKSVENELTVVDHKGEQLSFDIDVSFFDS
jgi:hypothetical protein